jgi:hypothetical protein
MDTETRPRPVSPPDIARDERGYHGEPWTDKFGRVRRPWQMHEANDGTITYGAEAIRAMNKDWEAGKMQGFQRDVGRGPQSPSPPRPVQRVTALRAPAGRAARPSTNTRTRGSRRTPSSTSSSSDDSSDLAGDPPPPASARPALAPPPTATATFIRQLRADDLHRVLTRRRDARSERAVFALGELFAWPREHIATGLSDLVADGRLTDAHGRLIVRRRAA